MLKWVDLLLLNLKFEVKDSQLVLFYFLLVTFSLIRRISIFLSYFSAKVYNIFSG